MEIKKVKIETDSQLSKLTNPLLAHVFTYRHFSESEVKEWLSEPCLCDPRSIPCVRECEKILLEILEKKEKILICGDYDADGICATAILMKALKASGFEVGFYIPDRLSEGYGMHVSTVEKAYAKGYRYFITVDNGVKSTEAMKKIRELNCHLILTDHHTYDEKDLDADCFVHPFLMEQPLQSLSGAGVALQIARLFLPEDKDIVALAAVAAIADCMDLKGENRSIVKLGLRYLNEGCMMPLQVLKNKPEARFDETVIGFQIAPKLNGTGRMADLAKANNTVRYLLLKDMKAILDGASQINRVNDARKAKTQEMEKTARNLMNEHKFQIIADDSFHEGVVGLVASRIVNDTFLPCAVLSGNEGYYKGSIRSIEGLNLIDFFKDFAYFDAFGGHAMAAGITLKKEYYEDFLNYIYAKEDEIQSVNPSIEILIVNEKDLTLNNVRTFLASGPFGNGFETVTFGLENVKIVRSVIMQEKHCKLISDSGIEILFFNAKPSLEYLSQVQTINVYGRLSVSEFKGVSAVSLIGEGFY